MPSKPMTNRERLLTALRGGQPDKTPFWYRLPHGAVERELRNRGLCSNGYYRCRQRIPGHHEVSFSDEKGDSFKRSIFSTPYGELSSLVRCAGFTDWTLEYLFKSPADYRGLVYLARNVVVAPTYEEYYRQTAELGEDGLVWEACGYSPLQEIIYRIMGTEQFCVEWQTNRDEVLALYQALTEKNRKITAIAADGPCEFVEYDGNVVAQVLGPEVFRKYFMPVYREVTDLMHRRGKRVGSHLDADNSLFMNLIGETGIDIVLAYDPGMSPPVKEARRRWPNKVLSLNFPSAWHWHSLEEIRNDTKHLIAEAEPGHGFIIGITEDVPPDRRMDNSIAIMDGIDEYFATPVACRCPV